MVARKAFTRWMAAKATAEEGNQAEASTLDLVAVVSRCLHRQSSYESN